MSVTSKLLMALCLAAGVVPAASAADFSPTIEELHVGFGGRYKVGYWTPVEVVLRGGDRETTGRVELTLADGDGVASRVVSPVCTLPTGGTSRIVLYAKFGRLDGSLSAAVRVDDAIVTQRTWSVADHTLPRAMPSRERLALVLGAPIGLEEAAARLQRETADRMDVVQLQDARDLPTRWYGFEGVDLLAIAPADEEMCGSLRDDAERLHALDEWLALGGRILFAPGERAAEMLADGSPLAHLAPGLFRQVGRLPRTSALESFVRSAPRIELPRQQRLNVIELASRNGVIVLREGDLPLVVRSPRAFGEVTFVAVDLAAGPLADWPGRERMIGRLLGDRSDSQREQQREEGRGSSGYLGLTDLSGQLRGALDQFPGVEIVPFWFVCGAAILYMLIIGADFFFLKYVVRRMEFTWLTFPLIAVAFVAGTYWLAYRSKGTTLRMNQVDLVDVDVASGRTRGTTWVNVYSPRTTSYDLSLVPQVRGQKSTGWELLWSWQGLPGSALGGMDQSSTELAPAAEPYEFSTALDTTQGVPLGIWSTKNFTGRWQCRDEPAVTGRLTAGADGVAQGSLTNRLDTMLVGCLLVSGRWAYDVGDFEPGRTIRFQPGQQRDLQHLFKDFKMVQEAKGNYIQVATPYNQASFDVRSILRQMSFYKASGGQEYTGLLNRYFSFVDMSDRLELGQAVFMGLASEGHSATEVSDAGRSLGGEHDRHWTLYRFVFPLEKHD